MSRPKFRGTHGLPCSARAILLILDRVSSSVGNDRKFVPLQHDQIICCYLSDSHLASGSCSCSRQSGYIKNDSVDEVSVSFIILDRSVRQNLMGTVQQASVGIADILQDVTI